MNGLTGEPVTGGAPLNPSSSVDVGDITAVDYVGFDSHQIFEAVEGGNKRLKISRFENGIPAETSDPLKNTEDLVSVFDTIGTLGGQISAVADAAISGPAATTPDSIALWDATDGSAVKESAILVTGKIISNVDAIQCRLISRESPGTPIYFDTNIDMQTHLITNVLNPSTSQDAATKSYVDSGIQQNQNIITQEVAELETKLDDLATGLGGQISAVADAAISGPADSDDNSIVVWDGTSGTAIKKTSFANNINVNTSFNMGGNPITNAGNIQCNNIQLNLLQPKIGNEFYHTTTMNCATAGKIIDLAPATQDNEVVMKGYVDASVASVVSGPATSDVNSLVLWDSTTGEQVKNSNVTFDGNCLCMPPGTRFETKDIASSSSSEQINFKADITAGLKPGTGTRASLGTGGNPFATSYIGQGYFSNRVQTDRIISNSNSVIQIFHPLKAVSTQSQNVSDPLYYTTKQYVDTEICKYKMLSSVAVQAIDTNDGLVVLSDTAYTPPTGTYSVTFSGLIYKEGGGGDPVLEYALYKNGVLIAHTLRRQWCTGLDSYPEEVHTQSVISVDGTDEIVVQVQNLENSVINVQQRSLILLRLGSELPA